MQLQKHILLFLLTILGPAFVFAQSIYEDSPVFDHYNGNTTQYNNHGGNVSWIVQYHPEKFLNEDNEQKKIEPLSIVRDNNLFSSKNFVNPNSNQTHSWVQQKGDGNEAVINENIWYPKISLSRSVKQFPAKSVNQYEDSRTFSESVRSYNKVTDNAPLNSNRYTRPNANAENLLDHEFSHFGESGYLFVEQINPVMGYNQMENPESDNSLPFIYSNQDISGSEMDYYVLQEENITAFKSLIRGKDDTEASGDDNESEKDNKKDKDRDIDKKLEENEAQRISSDNNIVRFTSLDDNKVYTFRQVGRGNVIDGFGTTWAESINGSLLDAEQIGNFNEIRLEQLNSKAQLSQMGDKNTSVIIQK